MRQINLLEPTVTMRDRTRGRRATDVDTGAFKLALGAALGSLLTSALGILIFA